MSGLRRDEPQPGSREFLFQQARLHASPARLLQRRHDERAVARRHDDAVVEVATGASKSSGWIPTFIDYLYVSITNSSAFSPTDTMPLSSRAKLLMGAQATAALLVTLVIVARAVGAIQ